LNKPIPQLVLGIVSIDSFNQELFGATTTSRSDGMQCQVVMLDVMILAGNYQT